jgi:hypothetical protein
MDYQLMKRLAVLLALWPSAATAQNAVTQQSPEQVYRQIVAVLAQDNARLGSENDILRQQLTALQHQMNDHKPPGGEQK